MNRISEKEYKKLQDHIKEMRDQILNRLFQSNLTLRGEYPYQEPEQDEQGTYYGYKVLYKFREMYIDRLGTTLVSPRYPGSWVDGELTADQEPGESTLFGIHFTKRAERFQLERWSFVCPDMYIPVLVKCALSGTVVETEQGFRAQHARIIGVFNGYWQSYQDYEEGAQYHSRPTPQADDEEGKWFPGTWDTRP
jgi:hypothetical protein